MNLVTCIHTYINGEVLTYVITVPVGSRGNCEVIKLIAVSIALGNKEIMYIDIEESTLQ